MRIGLSFPFPPQSASRDGADRESPQLSVRVFFRKLRLPVLGGVEDVQDANCVLLNTVNGYMTMPALSLPDQDITQVRPRLDHSSPRVVFA